MADPYAEFQAPASTPQGADPYAEFQAPATAAPAAQAEPQTPGFFKQLVAPLDPGTDEYAAKHPITGPLVRGLSSAGATVLGTPGAIYHAFADEPTEEERRSSEKRKLKGQSE